MIKADFCFQGTLQPDYMALQEAIIGCASQKMVKV